MVCTAQTFQTVGVQQKRLETVGIAWRNKKKAIVIKTFQTKNGEIGSPDSLRFVPRSVTGGYPAFLCPRVRSVFSWIEKVQVS